MHIKVKTINSENSSLGNLVKYLISLLNLCKEQLNLPFERRKYFLYLLFHYVTFLNGQ